MSVAGATTDSLWEVLEQTRARTLRLVEGVSECDLQRVMTPLLSPLIWDLGHIANFEQRWLLGEESAIDGLYNPFDNPRATRGELPILEPGECFEYMAAVRERVREALPGCDPFNVELTIGHEQQHNETMLQLLRMIEGYVPEWRERPADRPAVAPAAGPDEGDYWVEIPAGEYKVGTAATNGEFAYDNECQAHSVSLEPALIGRRPVTNREYLGWIDAGGYGDDRWWSDAGREWRQRTGVSEPLAWERHDYGWYERNGALVEPLAPDAPVVHVSWFEAQAFAAAHDARLPGEREWEVAASHDPGGGRTCGPWGERAWRPGDAVLDQSSFGTIPMLPGDGVPASPLGLEHALGQVWEWTASEFAPYPGFEPFRYRQYSQPFFDGRYRVLRGGSWATRPRTVDARFRNWDLPQRRQIFAGFRLARDVA